ncbi:hypothetical protein PVL30_000432 [Lodderomyces elongisporus]|uniref:uncharacterized protein n=1 Tax=Lodderomyces elongisporus TaxID=36914 RepID=UPI002923B9C7|nr:uncharacterized protein PVL30_000432 [Lodderomyces elongisporus]WLF76728.1 hypothetical protein PVL30_000432 [Lodderomyces elongisporus]
MSRFNSETYNTIDIENASFNQNNDDASIINQSTGNYLTLSSSRQSDDPAVNQVNQSLSNIRVICRFRPENSAELARGHCIATFPNPQTVAIQGATTTNHFTFDRVFEPHATQNDIYLFSIADIVSDMFAGINGTVIAYGQTGSGKTYTMFGNQIYDNHDYEETHGIIPRIAHDVFEKIGASDNRTEYTLCISLMEIYVEQIRDLLIDKSDKEEEEAKDQRQYTIQEDKIDGIAVSGLVQKEVLDELSLAKIVNQGLNKRQTASTGMNTESSRSHTILQIQLRQTDTVTGVSKRSVLSLVDLAGSEKVRKTGAQGQTLEEAKKINKSLSALSNVINALTDGRSTHIPYRDSKLTRILQDSLGGNSRTSLIINCSPSSVNELEILSTLRFGARAKAIRNNVHVNTEVSPNAIKKKFHHLEKVNVQNQLYIKDLEDELSRYRQSQIRPLSLSNDEFDVSSLFSGTNSDSIYSIDSTVRTVSPRQSVARLSRMPSRLPIPSSHISLASTLRPTSANFNRHSIAKVSVDEELERRDRKIQELENVILSMKMQNVANAHQEESKLFSLETSLHNIVAKLNEAESVNNNLRKHLLISEKIIESRDDKISKLKIALKDQQLLISRETLAFKNRLGDIYSKLNEMSVSKEEEMKQKELKTPIELNEQNGLSKTNNGKVGDSAIHGGVDETESASEKTMVIAPEPVAKLRGSRLKSANATDDQETISNFEPEPEFLDMSFDSSVNNNSQFTTTEHSLVDDTITTDTYKSIGTSTDKSTEESTEKSTDKSIGTSTDVGANVNTSTSAVSDSNAAFMSREFAKEGFSIYSSEKLDAPNEKDVFTGFHQEYVSINEFLKESRRRSIMSTRSVRSAKSAKSVKSVKSGRDSGLGKLSLSPSSQQVNNIQENDTDEIETSGMFRDDNNDYNDFNYNHNCNGDNKTKQNVPLAKVNKNGEKQHHKTGLGINLRLGKSVKTTSSLGLFQ